MQKIISLLWLTLLIYNGNAQNTIKVIVKDKTSNAPLMGVNVLIKKIGTTTNIQGYAELNDIPNGVQIITFSHSGYQTKTDTLEFPLTNTSKKVIFLDTEKEELEEIIVQSTRTSRTIGNTPTRIETIDGEELDEKNNMRPANVSMLLHESTGLQVQQTSATSGNASIRVQGLDGRYTQLLKDGYPNFGNFASGLSILEIPPLDLMQIEVIKGPASTLYGGGAIAGVINFISKAPKEEFEGDFIFNVSNIGQMNIGGYISKKHKKMGYSLLATANFQTAYDVDKDDFSEIPKSNNFTINPKIFFYPNSTTSLMFGNSFTKGELNGGDMQVIKGNSDATHTYFETNNTIRNISTLEFSKSFNTNTNFKLKQSVSIFDRATSIPNYNFEGVSTNSFTDVSIAILSQKHTIISGINIVADKFKQKNVTTHNSKWFSAGAYFQDTWDISDIVKTESGVRIDNVTYSNNSFSKNETFFLPRISTLFKISNKVTSRVGGGLGYKIPTIFTEQTERNQYQNILPLANVKAEKSIGSTVDVNYKTKFSSNLLFSINQLFFYTRINSPLVLQADGLGNYFFANAGKPVNSKGFETNLKFIYKEDLKLFVGYTFTNAKATYLNSNQFLPLLPKNKVNLTLMYEKEDNFKLGLESYFTDRQYLFNRSKTPSFWEFGFMAQKTFNKVSLFINFENFTDQRQSNYKTVANPPHNNPTFDDIWNHTEGFVFNGGVKLKL